MSTLPTAAKGQERERVPTLRGLPEPSLSASPPQENPSDPAQLEKSAKDTCGEPPAQPGAGQPHTHAHDDMLPSPEGEALHNHHAQNRDVSPFHNVGEVVRAAAGSAAADAAAAAGPEEGPGTGHFQPTANPDAVQIAADAAASVLHDDAAGVYRRVLSDANCDISSSELNAFF